MAQIRKTRQQKVQLAQRKQVKAREIKDETKPVAGGNEAVSVSSGAIIESAEGAPTDLFTSQVSGIYSHVRSELRRVTIVSAICVGLFVIATVLLSPMSYFVSLRQSLGIDNLW